jgi:hypothetical protein
MPDATSVPNSTIKTPALFSSQIDSPVRARWQLQGLQQGLKVRGRFAIDGYVFSRPRMSKLEMCGMQSDARDTPFRRLLGMVLSVADDWMAERRKLPVPQVRVRSLGANLGGRHFSRTLRRAEFHTARNHCVPSNFFHHIFLVRSSQTCTKLDEKIPRTVHHRELRQSPETNAFPAADFSPLFDNLWPRSAHPQVHAKQKNSTLSPIF